MKTSNGYQQLGYSLEITSSWKNGPNQSMCKLLDRALELTKSVPYEVTTRWLFYGLWQEGFWERGGGDAKDKAYKNFCKLMSRLRHSRTEFQDRWPINLADDRRDPVGGGGFTSAGEWLETAVTNLTCSVDRMTYSEYYVMVAFEAQAMQAQFKYICEPYGVTLWPFSGHTSIAYKKRLAEAIEDADADFRRPVVILYFGDLDAAGEQIPESAFRHVRKWCMVDFCAYWCGITLAQVSRYGVESDNGKYQWEALRHDAAVEIITGALNDFLRHEDILRAEKEAATMTAAARTALTGLL